MSEISRDLSIGTGRRLWSFFTLTFGLSWLCWVPAAISGQDVNASAWSILFILGGFGPSVAGVIMFYRNRNKEDRRYFWKRVFGFTRISSGWYLFIFLIFPVLLAINISLNGLLVQDRF